MAQAPAPPLVLMPEDKEALEKMASSQSLPYHMVREAKGLLMAAQGTANERIAKTLGVSRSTVLAWRRQFATDGVKWVGRVRKGRGRRRTIPQEKVDQIVHDTLHATPPDATQWSVRTMAKHAGVSKSTVQEIWSSRKINPHRVENFNLSNDKRFEEKLTDVVGLYMGPPENAVVLSVDKKSEVQALGRTQLCGYRGLHHLQQQRPQALEVDQDGRGDHPEGQTGPPCPGARAIYRTLR
jgi:DNA-binding XRE family transcriptional regulator